MAKNQDPVSAFFAKAAAMASEVGERGGGLADIRQKLVEEPWFGRAVTADPANDDKKAHWNALHEQLAGERGTVSQQEPERDHERER